jgi:hypothetical protein
MDAEKSSILVIYLFIYKNPILTYFHPKTPKNQYKPPNNSETKQMTKQKIKIN